MEGLLLVDKPVNWTSFDVVKYVRGVVSRASGIPNKRVKVGHSGTLDPFATGLIILMVGKNYTSQAEHFLKLDKSYKATMELGKVSSTGDPEGELTESNVNGLHPTRSEVEAVLKTFEGPSKQTPPAFSAIKVDGVRAYKLARQNLPVKLNPREINIRSIELISYDYPLVEFVTHVSSGTYIRTLVEDIGSALKTGAYTKKLRRLSIDSYSIDQAKTIEDITEQTIASMLENKLSN